MRCYQLVRTSGRELARVGETTPSAPILDLASVPRLPRLDGADAVRAYSEEYEYDLLGNIKEAVRHRSKPQAGIGSAGDASATAMPSTTPETVTRSPRRPASVPGDAGRRGPARARLRP